MTEQEAARLEFGEVVEYLWRGEWRYGAAVARVQRRRRKGGVGGEVSAVGVVPLDQSGGTVMRSPERIRYPETTRQAPYDPLTMLAASDWLEEHGHCEAAAALREAFGGA